MDKFTHLNLPDISLITVNTNVYVDPMMGDITNVFVVNDKLKAIVQSDEVLFVYNSFGAITCKQLFDKMTFDGNMFYLQHKGLLSRVSLSGNVLGVEETQCFDFYVGKYGIIVSADGFIHVVRLQDMATCNSIDFSKTGLVLKQDMFFSSPDGSPFLALGVDPINLLNVDAITYPDCDYIPSATARSIVVTTEKSTKMHLMRQNKTALIEGFSSCQRVYFSHNQNIALTGKMFGEDAIVTMSDSGFPALQDVIYIHRVVNITPGYTTSSQGEVKWPLSDIVFVSSSSNPDDALLYCAIRSGSDTIQLWSLSRSSHDEFVFNAKKLSSIDGITVKIANQLTLSRMIFFDKSSELFIC